MDHPVIQTLCFTSWCGTITTFVGLVRRKRGKNAVRGAYPTSPDELQSFLHVHSRPIVEQRAYNEGTIRQA